MMLSFVRPALHDMKWAIGLDDFEELLASKRESAPRPHGLPYSVHRSARGIGARFLFAAYRAALQGSALPVGFGARCTVFMFKIYLLIRSPGSVRPLTL